MINIIFKCRGCGKINESTLEEIIDISATTCRCCSTDMKYDDIKKIELYKE